jgi:hypothetical protein
MKKDMQNNEERTDGPMIDEVNTKEGLKKELEKGLSGLKDTVKKRTMLAEAGTPLIGFVIGRVGYLSPNGPYFLLKEAYRQDENLKGAPLVMTSEECITTLTRFGTQAIAELYQGMVEKFDDLDGISVADVIMQEELKERSSRNFFPPESLVCPHCGKGWSLRKADLTIEKDHRTLPLDAFTHATFKDVQDYIETRNAKDDQERLTLNPIIETADGQSILSTLLSNGHSAMDPDCVIDPDYRISPGDIGIITSTTAVHDSCEWRVQRKKTLQGSFRELFARTGFSVQSIKKADKRRIPLRNEEKGEWFKVKTDKGNFTPGIVNGAIHLVQTDERGDLEHLFMHKSKQPRLEFLEKRERYAVLESEGNLKDLLSLFSYYYD